MLAKLVQLSNERISMLFSLFGSVRLVNDLQPANAYSPILVTLAGIVNIAWQGHTEKNN